MTKEALHILGLASLDVLPADFLAGGATWRVIQGGPIDHLRFEGRWVSSRSVESYIREAMCLVVSSQLTTSEASLVYRLTVASAALWATPPHVALLAIPAALGWRPHASAELKFWSAGEAARMMQLAGKPMSDDTTLEDVRPHGSEAWRAYKG